MVVGSPVSRLVVDVERFSDNGGEPIAARGMGGRRNAAVDRPRGTRDLLLERTCEGSGANPLPARETGSRHQILIVLLRERRRREEILSQPSFPIHQHLELQVEAALARFRMDGKGVIDVHRLLLADPEIRSEH